MEQTAPSHDLDIVGIIDYLGNLLGDHFYNDVSYIYFGDIGVYPPQAFKDAKGNDVACIAISPRYNRAVPEHTNLAWEEREIGINITVIVNMIPYFEAFPEEAYGERKLAKLVSRIHSFLTDADLQTLYGRVSSSKVGDIEWNWSQRGDDTATRDATIVFEAKVNIKR